MVECGGRAELDRLQIIEVAVAVEADEPEGDRRVARARLKIALQGDTSAWQQPPIDYF